MFYQILVTAFLVWAAAVTIAAAFVAGAERLHKAAK